MKMTTCDGLMLITKLSKQCSSLCLAHSPVCLFQGVENVEAYIPDAIWYDFEKVSPSSRTTVNNVCVYIQYIHIYRKDIKCK